MLRDFRRFGQNLRRLTPSRGEHIPPLPLRPNLGKSTNLNLHAEPHRRFSQRLGVGGEIPFSPYLPAQASPSAPLPASISRTFQSASPIAATWWLASHDT